MEFTDWAVHVRSFSLDHIFKVRYYFTTINIQVTTTYEISPSFAQKQNFGQSIFSQYNLHTILFTGTTSELFSQTV